MIEPPTNTHLAAANPTLKSPSNLSSGHVSQKQNSAESEPLLIDTPALLAHGSQRTVRHLRQHIERLQAHTRKLDPTLQQHLAQITHDVESLVQLTEALQTLEHLQRDSTSLRFESIELGDVLMSILPQWKQRAPQYELELALPGEIPAILADPTYVGSSINLLIEASVMLAPSQATVRVSIRPQLDDVLVSVQYTGLALSEQDSEHLFEPFYQPEQREPFAIAGGIGLTLAQAILWAHGGRLWAQNSADGTSTALVAAWPLIPSPPTLSTASANALPVARERLPIAAERPVILVLDSDARMLRYLRANLDAQRFKPVLAKDSGELLQLVELEEPDVLLLDLHTIGTQPEEVDALLQELQASVSAPIICIAQQNNPLECARLLDKGAVDYLAKPFSLEELLARIRVAVRTHEAATQAPQREAVFRSGDLSIDFGQRRVCVGNEQITLSKTEFKLLRVLAGHAGMVLAHETLLSRVWGPGYREEVEFVWVYIRRLRKKIEPDPSAPTYIQTVPGVGYRLARL